LGGLLPVLRSLLGLSADSRESSPPPAPWIGHTAPAREPPGEKAGKGGGPSKASSSRRGTVLFSQASPDGAPGGGPRPLDGASGPGGRTGGHGVTACPLVGGGGSIVGGPRVAGPLGTTFPWRLFPVTAWLNSAPDGLGWARPLHLVGRGGPLPRSPVAAGPAAGGPSAPRRGTDFLGRGRPGPRERAGTLERVAWKATFLRVNSVRKLEAGPTKVVRAAFLVHNPARFCALLGRPAAPSRTLPGLCCLLHPLSWGFLAHEAFLDPAFGGGSGPGPLGSAFSRERLWAILSRRMFYRNPVGPIDGPAPGVSPSDDPRVDPRVSPFLEGGPGCFPCPPREPIDPGPFFHVRSVWGDISNRVLDPVVPRPVIARARRTAGIARGRGSRGRGLFCWARFSRETDLARVSG